MDFQQFLQKIKKVLLQPDKFFVELKKEKGVGTAFKYLAILLAFSMIAMTVLGLIWRLPLMLISDPEMANMLPLMVIILPIILVIFYGISLGMSFVSAGILHFWVVLFGGKADYEKTYQLAIYSRTPTLVAGWIPLVGIAAMIYGLWLLIVGTEKVHGMSRTKAALIYIIPVVAMFVLLILFIVAMLILAAVVVAGSASTG